MLDIETMGNSANSAIVALGAVHFDERGVLDSYYSGVSLESSLDIGLDVDASTVMWWMSQSDDARSALSVDVLDILTVLTSFGLWIGRDPIVWGNGAAFDNIILSNAYRKVKIAQPWDFWNDRCYRTIKSLYPNVKMLRRGVHHNALDDAKSQALHLLDIISEKNLEIEI